MVAQVEPFFYSSDYSLREVVIREGLIRLDPSHDLKIGEVARLTEMSPRTIRYYQEIGLLHPVKRIEGGKRIFSEEDLQRLKFIRRLKHLGLTLSEMRELADIYEIHRTNRKVLIRLCELLGNQAIKIDERINNLHRLKEEILSYQEKILQKLAWKNPSKKAGVL
jgi:MerR family transcriptional regulator, repressor of the yfmOP operon